MHIILYLLKIILIKSVVNKNRNKYSYNIFSEKFLYKYELTFVYYKCYIMIEFVFLKWLMSIKQKHQKSMIFVTIGIS